MLCRGRRIQDFLREVAGTLVMQSPKCYNLITRTSLKTVITEIQAVQQSRNCNRVPIQSVCITVICTIFLKRGLASHPIHASSALNLSLVVIADGLHLMR